MHTSFDSFNVVKDDAYPAMQHFHGIMLGQQMLGYYKHVH